MTDQLVQYVNLLFAGNPGTEDIKQEILQNSLDRYEDLIAQGKTPEAAYSLAISGIGDISEILNNGHEPIPSVSQSAAPASESEHKTVNGRAIAIAMYIASAIPLLALGNVGNGVLGLCITLLMIAAATALIIMSRKETREVSDSDTEGPAPEASTSTPRQQFQNHLNKLIWIIGLAVYFILSFASGAWHITWLLFPIVGCLQGLAKAILELKEEKMHEE